MKMLRAHFTEDEQLLSLPNTYEHQEGDHNELAEMLIHHLYVNYDAFILLLTKSQGTHFENSVDRIVYSIIMPPVVSVIVNYIVINKRLSGTALSLIRNEQKTGSYRNLNLGKMGFILL